jgi:signal transduction histidine kinase
VALLPRERADAVSVSCPPSLAPVWADHDRLEQVVVNLLDNAFRHNGPDVRVSVEVSVLGDETVAVTVSDDGKGITPDIKAQLLEAQARGVASALSTGLGLSIARGIARAHEGELQLVDSEQGACFQLLLPVEGPGEAQ